MSTCNAELASDFCSSLVVVHFYSMVTCMQIYVHLQMDSQRRNKNHISEENYLFLKLCMYMFM